MHEEFTIYRFAIEDVLSQHRIEIKDIKLHFCPRVYQFKIFLAHGGKAAKVLALEDELTQALGVSSIRMVRMDDCIAVEVPIRKGGGVSISVMMTRNAFYESKARLPLALGATWGMKIRAIDLADAPHLLVAGASGQGRDMFLKGVRACLDAKSPDARQVWIDTTAKDADMVGIAARLEGLCDEMERRLRSDEALPYIIVIVNEYAPLVVCRWTYRSIIRLAQNGHRAGIHFILATQRPSRDVITMLIKSNFPTRIAFKVSTKSDSLLILDEAGAEKLLGTGDMLFLWGGRVERIQGPTID